MAMSVNLAFGLLLVGICQISAMSHEEMLKMTKIVHDDCVGQTGVDEKLIDACKDGNFAEDPKLKCYMKCLLTIVPIMDDDGDIDVDTAISMLPEQYQELAAPILRECGTIKGADNCDTAFLTNKCWQSKAPDRYFLI